jgi:hypothetical protein
MTDLNEMWNRLAQHQSFAEKYGYGEAWANLCRERTIAAYMTYMKTEAEAARAAACAAAEAALSAEAAVAGWAKSATDLINKAEGRNHEGA